MNKIQIRRAAELLQVVSTKEPDVKLAAEMRELANQLYLLARQYK